jgi:hypothetical protein
MDSERIFIGRVNGAEIIYTFPCNLPKYFTVAGMVLYVQTGWVHGKQSIVSIHCGHGSDYKTNGYFFAFTFSEFFFTLNFTIFVISVSGKGLSNGNCTDPLAPA